MRGTQVWIGLSVLAIISTVLSLQVVRNLSRPRDTKVLEVGVEKPEQVFSPRELIATPAPAPAQAVPEEEPEPVVEVKAPPQDKSTSMVALLSSPESRRSLTLPWHGGKSRIEEAMVLAGSGGYEAPRWSPLGLDLAFTSSQAPGLFFCGARPGSRIRTLAPDPVKPDQWLWNRDGMSVRFEMLDGNQCDALITGERMPAPAGNPLVFERDDSIFVRHPAKGEIRVSNFEDRHTRPQLSPDGSRVVFEGRSTGLYIAEVEEPKVFYLGRGTHPSWLPDSSGIVFDLGSGGSTDSPDSDLWLLSLDTMERTNLTDTPGIPESWPSVAPDGERIAFVADGSIYVGKLMRQK